MEEMENLVKTKLKTGPGPAYYGFYDYVSDQSESKQVGDTFHFYVVDFL